MNKKNRIIRSAIRTAGALLLLAVGAYICSIGFGWHNNVLAEVNSDVAFVLCAIFDFGGLVLVATGIYGLCPILVTAIMAAVLDLSEKDTRMLILPLKRKYWW